MLRHTIPKTPKTPKTPKAFFSSIKMPYIFIIKKEAEDKLAVLKAELVVKVESLDKKYQNLKDFFSTLSDNLDSIVDLMNDVLGFSSCSHSGYTNEVYESLVKIIKQDSELKTIALLMHAFKRTKDFLGNGLEAQTIAEEINKIDKEIQMPRGVLTCWEGFKKQVNDLLKSLGAIFSKTTRKQMKDSHQEYSTYRFWSSEVRASKQYRAVFTKTYLEQASSEAAGPAYTPFMPTSDCF